MSHVTRRTWSMPYRKASWSIKLLQLGWVFDVNFAETLARIHERQFLEQIVAFLPRTDDIARAAKYVFNYVASRLD